MDPIYVLQAEVLKTLSSPRRLEIIHVLAEGPREVSRLAEELGISPPNVSQHLSVMRAAGIVEGEREGREVRYRLADPDIIVACDIMKGVLQRRIARLADLSAERPTTGQSTPAPASPEVAAAAGVAR
jgi:DNA-binding transcriptional ArsR family regulator